MRVLVVDDSERLRKALATGLQADGMVVETAADGQEALELLQVAPFDVVVLDIMMPKVDGLQVLRHVRAARLPTHILVLSARDQVDDRVEALNLGADDYLVKPFAFAEVKARILALARRHFEEASPLVSAGPVEVDTTARIAHANGAQVLAIATLPFSVESARRARACDGLEVLGHEVDALMVMDNDRLLEVAGELAIDAAFNLVDEAIAGVVRSIATAAMEQGVLPLDAGRFKEALTAPKDAAVAPSRAEGARAVPVTAARAAIAHAMAASLWQGGQGSVVLPDGALPVAPVTITSVKVGVPPIVETPPGAADMLVITTPPGTDTTARGAAATLPGGPGQG